MIKFCVHYEIQVFVHFKYLDIIKPNDGVLYHGIDYVIIQQNKCSLKSTLSTVLPKKYSRGHHLYGEKKTHLKYLIFSMAS